MQASPRQGAKGFAPLDNEAAQLRQLLLRAQRVLLTAPAPADGDSIGSQLGMRGLIKAHFPQLDVRIVNEDVLLERYRHLPGANDAELPARYRPGDFDLGIVVDGGAERLGATQALFNACKMRVQVDHHAVGAPYAYDLRVFDPRAAATTEVVYRLFLAQALACDLSAEIAQSLYVGVIFDTGYFRHGNTTPETLEFGAALLRTGFNFSEVGERAMLSRTMGGVQLMGRVMAESKASANGRVLSGMVPREMLRKFAARDEDRDGIIDQLSLVKGVQVSVLFHETESGDVKVSFRSKGEFDVAEFARELSAEGGGHRKASGCTLKGPLEVAARYVLDTLEKMLA